MSDGVEFVTAEVVEEVVEDAVSYRPGTKLAELIVLIVLVIC